MSDILKPDEIEWIKANQERCKACGHLNILHHEGSGHYGDEDDFCYLDDCQCRNWKIKKPRARVARRLSPPKA